MLEIIVNIVFSEDGRNEVVKKYALLVPLELPLGKLYKYLWELNGWKYTLTTKLPSPELKEKWNEFVEYIYSSLTDDVEEKQWTEGGVRRASLEWLNLEGVFDF